MRSTLVCFAMLVGTALAQQLTINLAKTVDLTYPFDEHAIYWPTAKPFEWQKESWGVTPAGYWYTAARYAASEHGGTHVDAPIHFGKDKRTMDELSLKQLIAPAIVIDISAKCANDADYRLSADDISAWEKKHKPIAAGSIALIHTGWGRFWPDKKKYLGSDTPGDTAHLHFPGISREAAELLVKRNVAGVGLDTASLDYGQSKDFIAHQTLNGANIYGLENVANLERLPATGATLIALPMKIKGGTGGPVRIVAALP
jgi:kynurenine formamidase